MPSKKQYNLVNDDAYDSRIPLHSEEAFQSGITFHAKFIGTLDIPRPSSRVEIVAAMRRIRYEFKTKGINKKKINLTVSVDGVKVVLSSKKKKNQWSWDENKLLIMQHPIYRIFYVSHDSQDLKIFSFIARDGGSSIFKCNVFKSNKKSQAMKIVRTVGQAFEVCHKLSLTHVATESQEDIPNRKRNNDIGQKGLPQENGMSEPSSCDNQSLNIMNINNQDSIIGQPNKLEPLAPPLCEKLIQNETELGETYASPLSEPLPLTGAILPEGTPLSVYHQLQILRHQLEQQSQQTQVAVAQVQLLKDQVTAESTARLEAQAHNHQLMIHNKELLDYIQGLVKQVQHLEQRMKQLEGKGNLGLPDLPAVPEVATVSCNVTTPSPAPVNLPNFLQKDNQQLAVVSAETGDTGSHNSFSDKWLQRYSPNSSTTSSLSSNQPSQDKMSAIQCSFPRKNSLTRVNYPSNSDRLFKQSSVQTDSSFRVKPAVVENVDVSINLAARDITSQHTVSEVSTPPRLHPPPQRSRGNKSSQLNNCLADEQNSSILNNTVSSDKSSRILPTYDDVNSQRHILSWPPLTSNQISSSKLSSEGYSSFRQQNSHSKPLDTEQFINQAARNISKINFKSDDYPRMQSHLFNR